jgi:hypothetical protein
MPVTPLIGAGYIAAVESLATQINAGGAETVTSTSISDSTSVGRAVLTAADAATARTAIGAVNAVAASTSVAGIAKQITFTAQQSPAFADLTAVTTAYNALLTKLITAGIMPAS